MPGASFEAVTGRLGIGAIAFLGLFLIVDGLQIGAFDLVELYGKSTTWGLVVVVPTAVVIYIVGVICFGFAELALARFPAFAGPTVAHIMAVSRTGSPLLQQVFSDHLRTHDLLKGAAVSFLILALGCAAEWRNIGGFDAILWVTVVGALGLSGLALVFARRAAEQAIDLATAVVNVHIPHPGVEGVAPRA